MYPPKEVSELRNISGLLNLDKITEKILGELIVADTKHNIDVTQYGNQPKTSIQHYLVNMLHEVLISLDKSNNAAVILSMIDWKEAFPRQCPKLGIEAFMKLGVRPCLLPILVNFFQDRTMQVKWHGILSAIRTLKGGGPMGSTLGLLEYIMQSNDNSDDLKSSEKFKFIDDLSILEVICLLSIGIASFNCKAEVPNDIGIGDCFIPAENLKTQAHINKICEWTTQNKMMLNHKKSNLMIFNNSKKMKVKTRIQMNGVNLQIVDSAKLLGTIITSDLKWEKNTAELVKKGNCRLQILRKAKKYTTDYSDLKTIYIAYVRSIIEQSAVVWHSSLTQENSLDIERIQKGAVRNILGENFVDYERGLDTLNLQSLSERREKLCLNFAQNCKNNPKTKQHFRILMKKHIMQTRKGNKYEIDFAKKKRFKSSTIPYSQNLLNEHELAK